MTYTTETHTQHIALKPLRVKFTNEVMDELSIFAKIHQFDDRKSFNSYWDEWKNGPEMSILISNEILRITTLGYTGDIIDKMYKSARYYFRNKSLVPSPHATRKEYEVVQKHILESMDEHIKLQIASKLNIKDELQFIKVSPADSFNKFCEEYQETILMQLNNEHGPRVDNGQYVDNVNIIHVRKLIEKLKKIYKNRFYNIRVKLL